MAIETWFPLAVYFEDLPITAEIRQRMLDYLRPTLEQYLPTPTRGLAYTGDTRGVWQIHEVEAFAWLRQHVERHAILFTRSLGVNLGVIGFYFQRSWPVFTRRGEIVNRHSHPNASLSAVYFLSVPHDAEKAGRLVFHNDADQNSMGTGFHLPATGGIAQWNALNYKQVTYTPQEGRLILFPSRQTHSVEPNGTDEVRISISFDIALTCSRHVDPGEHEFLAPPPEEWDEFVSRAGDEAGPYSKPS